MKKINFKDFMEKFKLKDENMKETDLRRVYNYSINSRDSTIYFYKVFVKLDNESEGGIHWVFFRVKLKNPITLIVSEDLPIKIYSTNYQNQ